MNTRTSGACLWRTLANDSRGCKGDQVGKVCMWVKDVNSERSELKGVDEDEVDKHLGIGRV